jgi:hypothetical protein
MSLPLPRPSRWPAQHHGRVAMATLVALALFVATALWTQWARDDLDWVQATLSLYLHGPWGLALRTAYCVLALAIIIALLSGAIIGGGIVLASLVIPLYAKLRKAQKAGPTVVVAPAPTPSSPFDGR